MLRARSICAARDFQITRVEKSVGHGDEVRVTNIAVAVGKRQSASFSQCVHAVRPISAQAPSGNRSTYASICATAMPPDDGGGMPQTRKPR